MNRIRKRSLYISALIIVIILGLLSRRYASSLPIWVNLYLGDILWGLMIYLLFRAVFIKQRPLMLFALATFFALGVEFSQLYHAPWIDSLRNTRLGALLLGRGFLWSDVVCYIIGTSLGCVIDKKS